MINYKAKIEEIEEKLNRNRRSREDYMYQFSDDDVQWLVELVKQLGKPFTSEELTEMGNVTVDTI